MFNEGWCDEPLTLNTQKETMDTHNTVYTILHFRKRKREERKQGYRKQNTVGYTKTKKEKTQYCRLCRKKIGGGGTMRKSASLDYNSIKNLSLFTYCYKSIYNH